MATDKITPMDAVLSAIREIQARKRAANIVPDHVLIFHDHLFTAVYQDRLLEVNDYQLDVEAQRLSEEFRQALDALQAAAGYYIQESRKWKDDAAYWYKLYEEGKDK